MANQYIIAHDVGTGGSKAVLVDLETRTLGREFEPYPTSYPQPDWAEQDPQDWWAAITSSTKKLLEKTGTNPADVIGMSFSSQMIGVIPVDEDGQPLLPAIIWLDSRAEKQAQRIIRLFTRPLLLALAGGVPTGKDVLPKLMWLQESEKDLYEKTYQFLNVGDYLVFRSTGKFVTDRTGASATGLFERKKENWSKLLARLFKIDTTKLPKIVKSIDNVGGLTAEAAQELGLKEGTPVIYGTGDIPAAAVGSGALGEGQAHLYIGTSGWVGLHTEKNVNDGRRGINNISSANPDKYLLFGETECAGSCLQWFREQLATPEELEAERDGRDVYEILNEVAAEVEPGAKKLIFTPWLYGERAPVLDVSLRGGFINLSIDHRREHMLRALYEGVAYQARWVIESIEKLGYELPTIRALGGGAKGDIWMQIYADVTGRTIEQVKDPQEAGAVGIALLVGLGLGIYKDFNSISQVVKVKKTFEPDFKNKKIYDKLFATFKDFYHRNTKLYRNLNIK